MKVLGHRGCITKRSPYQNSLEAFKKAIKHVDGFEADACVSKDGDVFFIHEEIDKAGSQLCKYLDKASIKTVGKNHLYHLLSEDIKKLKLKDGQPIPCWDKTIALFTNNPTKIFNIEIKAEHAASAVIEKLKEAFNKKLILPEQIIISSFSHSSLLLVRNEFSQIKIGALFTSHINLKRPLVPHSTDKDNFYFPMTSENITSSLIKSINPQFIIAPHTELIKKQMEMIQKFSPQAKAIIWTGKGYNDIDKNLFNQATKDYAKNGILASIIVNDVENYER